MQGARIYGMQGAQNIKGSSGSLFLDSYDSHEQNVWYKCTGSETTENGTYSYHRT